METPHDDPRQSERVDRRDERVESTRDERGEVAQHAREQQETSGGFLDSSSVSRIESQWSEIKTRFVDDPRGALDQAFGMLEDAFEEISTRMRREYDGLREGIGGKDVSTEDLRRRLQDCRSLIDRMVPRSLH